MKIFYNKKQEVKIGDIVSINDFSVPVSDELIKLNPNLFENIDKVSGTRYWEFVGNADEFTKGKIYQLLAGKLITDTVAFIDDNCKENGFSNNLKCFKPSTKEAFERQELLEEAKKRYPVGTKFILAHLSPRFKETAIIKDCETLRFETPNRFTIVTGTNNSDFLSKCVYYDGKWASRYLFTSDDGEDIYESDRVWIVFKNSKTIDRYAVIVNNLSDVSHIGCKRFSTKEAAEAYVGSLKEKTLQDYESELLIHDAWVWMFKNEPKLYWIRVLQLIADDICTLNERYWVIEYDESASDYVTDNYKGYPQSSCVKFDTGENVDKAIKIMGDNLKNVFL